MTFQSCNTLFQNRDVSAILLKYRHAIIEYRNPNGPLQHERRQRKKDEQTETDALDNTCWVFSDHVRRISSCPTIPHWTARNTVW